MQACVALKEYVYNIAYLAPHHRRTWPPKSASIKSILFHTPSVQYWQHRNPRKAKKSKRTAELWRQGKSGSDQIYLSTWPVVCVRATRRKAEGIPSCTVCSDLSPPTVARPLSMLLFVIRGYYSFTPVSHRVRLSKYSVACAQLDASILQEKVNYSE